MMMCPLVVSLQSYIWFSEVLQTCALRNYIIILLSNYPTKSMNVSLIHIRCNFCLIDAQTISMCDKEKAMGKSGSLGKLSLN